MDSFGYVLRRFARAVDIVDDDVIHEVGTLLQDYVQKALAVEYLEIMREMMVGGEAGLGTLWSSDHGGPQHAWPIRNADGACTCQAAYAFDTGTPVWVVPADHTVLDQAQTYADLWSDSTDLPAYHLPVDGLAAKTSIILPLQIGTRRIGALCMDATEPVEITPVARQELQLAAEAVAILCWNYEATRNSRASKKTALGELQQVLPESPQLTKPHVFVASSCQADTAVDEAITAVLERDEFRDRLTANHWQENQQPGSLHEQMFEDIRKAQFGICYLSEPDGAEPDAVEGERPRYRDNPNVLFEAGMLHGLRRVGHASGWIPVREEDAPPPPFDVAAENHIVVPRHEDGSLDRAKFEEQLSGYVRELIGDSA